MKKPKYREFKWLSPGQWVAQAGFETKLRASRVRCLNHGAILALSSKTKCLCPLSLAAIMMHNKPLQNSMVCKSDHFFSLWVCSWLFRPYSAGLLGLAGLTHKPKSWPAIVWDHTPQWVNWLSPGGHLTLLHVSYGSPQKANQAHPPDKGRGAGANRNTQMLFMPLLVVMSNEAFAAVTRTLQRCIRAIPWNHGQQILEGGGAQ